MIGLAGLVTRPLGPLAGTMLLVLTLPPLAASLDALGWAEIVATRIGRAGISVRGQLFGAYVAWLGVSAVLTLDVAAVVAVPVGVRLADPQNEESRQDHLGAAILGSNVGSLLFPFSNLTNLILVSATGISFGAYVATSWLPQLGAALVVGLLLVRRTRQREYLSAAADLSVAADPSRAVAGDVADAVPAERSRLTVGAGVIAVIGAMAAVVLGLAGADVAPVFAASTALVAGCAIAAGRGGIGTPELVRTIPVSGVAVVLAAAIAVGPLGGLAGLLPDVQSHLAPIVALPAIALVGGLLAVSINNLPAAAFGAIWLVGGTPADVVAFLIGTNLFALATPHGSLATILARQLGLRHGVDLSARTYLARAWRYALVSSLVAVAILVIGR